MELRVRHSQSRFGKEIGYDGIKHVIGVPITSQQYVYSITATAKSLEYQIMPSPSKHYPKITHNAGRVNSAISKVMKLRESIDIFARGIREHVRLGPKFSETVKGKLRLGARILKVGGVEKVMKKNFNVIDGEKLFCASQCYLSTTAGPIAGLLFVSNQRLAFCSDRSIKLSSSSSSSSVKMHYKVMIPLRKIKRGVESENVKNPKHKYVQIVTEDDFEFWFMGFFNHQRTFSHLHHAIHHSTTDFTFGPQFKLVS